MSSPVKFSLRNQVATLAACLPEFRKRSLNYLSTAGLPRAVFRREVPTTRRDLLSCDLRFLFGYDVFPPSMIKFAADWQLDGREMRVGDTIALQTQVPPGFGFYLVFGVRIVAMRHAAGCASFTYGTLRGHPETGINAFSFRVTKDGVVAGVETTAKPGLPLSRLLARVFTNRYVLLCNRRAAERMVEKFVEANP